MTPKDGRVVTIGCILLATLLVLRIVPWIVRSAIAAEAGLRDRARLVALARADLATASQFGDSAARLSRALAQLAPKILSGNTAAEALADLSGRVNLAASEHRAKLDRVDPVADSARGGRLRRATLRASFACDVRGLVSMLQALELGKAALTVKDLRITAIDPGSLDKSPEVLRVEVTVSGWFLASREAENGRRRP